jgi:hypothetical protein
VTTSVEDQAIALQAENDLLRQELDGLYQEKKSVDQLVQMLLASENTRGQEVADLQYEKLELLMLIGKVDQLYGPFAEFDKLLRSTDVRSGNRARGVAHTGARRV